MSEFTTTIFFCFFEHMGGNRDDDQARLAHVYNRDNEGKKERERKLSEKARADLDVYI